MSVLRYTKTVLDVASTLAVTIAAGLFVWKLFANEAPRMRTPPVTSVQDAIAPELATNVLGRGRLAIVEFSDFQCPFCGAYARDTFPEIKSSLIDSGEVRYVVMHFPLERIHPFALKAAEAAECAARQGKYWAMHDRLFTDVGALAPSELPRHAKALGLEESSFTRCVETGETLEKVRAEQTEGGRLGVMATPAFFFGSARDDGSIDLVKRINGIASADVFKSQVAALAPRRSLLVRQVP